VRSGVRSRKLRFIGQLLDGWPKINYLELLRASEGTLSRWSRLHLQSLAPTNPHWARVVGYGPFSICVIHKEGLCPSNGDNNRLMMMTMMSNTADVTGGRSTATAGASKSSTMLCLSPNYLPILLRWFPTFLIKCYKMLHTYIPLTLHSRRGNTGLWGTLRTWQVVSPR
jgi:hypothetical protein